MIKEPEDEEFERIEREQARSKDIHKRQVEGECEKRCPACNHLLEDSSEAND
jgi:hypothetical protein